MKRRKKNSPQVWDNVWENSNSKKENLHNFNKTKKSIHWIRMKRILIKKFGSLNDIKTIEIGAGTGMHSLILASEGADVTVLDYSKKAIKASKLLFKHNNLKANFVQEDALRINKGLLSKFDVSMSFGTAEHFSGKNRLQFIQTHVDVLKKNGLTFISVPNKWNILYLMHKFLSESFGRWNFGEEYPFSQMEFNKIGKKLGYKFQFIGHTIFSDPFLIYPRFKKLLGYEEQYAGLDIKKQMGTPLDKYFAGAITAIAQK